MLEQHLTEFYATEALRLDSTMDRTMDRRNSFFWTRLWCKARMPHSMRRSLPLLDSSWHWGTGALIAGMATGLGESISHQVFAAEPPKSAFCSSLSSCAMVSIILYISLIYLYICFIYLYIVNHLYTKLQQTTNFEWEWTPTAAWTLQGFSGDESFNPDRFEFVLEHKQKLEDGF